MKTCGKAAGAVEKKALAISCGKAAGAVEKKALAISWGLAIALGLLAQVRGLSWIGAARWF